MVPISIYPICKIIQHVDSFQLVYKCLRVLENTLKFLENTLVLFEINRLDCEIYKCQCSIEDRSAQKMLILPLTCITFGQYTLVSLSCQ